MRTHDQIQQEIDGLFKTTTWASHPRFPVEDWQYEVRNNDTRQGYATWLYNRLEQDEGEPEGFFFCPACRYEWESAKSEDNCPKCGQYVQGEWDV